MRHPQVIVRRGVAVKPWAYCRNQPRKCVCVCALLRANSVVPCLGGPPPQVDTGEFEVSQSETWATHRRIVGNVWHPEWTVVKVMFAENPEGDRRATQCPSGSDRGSYVQTGGGGSRWQRVLWWPAVLCWPDRPGCMDSQCSLCVCLAPQSQSVARIQSVAPISVQCPARRANVRFTVLLAHGG